MLPAKYRPKIGRLTPEGHHSHIDTLSYITQILKITWYLGVNYTPWDKCIYNTAMIYRHLKLSPQYARGESHFYHTTYETIPISHLLSAENWRASKIKVISAFQERFNHWWITSFHDVGHQSGKSWEQVAIVICGCSFGILRKISQILVTERLEHSRSSYWLIINIQV